MLNGERIRRDSIAPRNLRIGLFGYYNYGNFGDDLMALMIRRHLSQNGFEVIVHGLTDVDAADFNIHRTDDLHSLVVSSDVVVVGGGGLLCKTNPSPESIEYQQRLAFILDHCRRWQKPVMGVSLGGSGDTKLGSWKEPALDLVRQAAFCTFRNPEDLAIAQRCGRHEFTWYPDIVWLTSQFFPKIAEPKARPTIAVHVVGSRYGRRMVRLLPWVLDRQSDAEVCYLDVHSTSKSFSGLASRRPTSVSSKYRFSRLKNDVQFLANCDMVITNRLHSGLAAMSYGAAMVSLFGHGKTRLALRVAGKSNCDVSYSNVAMFLWRMRSRRLWQNSYAGLSESRLRQIQREAMNHLTELVRALDCVAPQRCLDAVNG